MWRHVPWLLGLIFCPLFGGGVDRLGQAAVFLGLAITLFLASGQLPLDHALGKRNKLILLVLLALIFLSLFPVSRNFLTLMEPARASLPFNLTDPQFIAFSFAGAVSRSLVLLGGIALFLIARLVGITRENRSFILFFLLAGILLMAASEILRRPLLEHGVLSQYYSHYDTSAGTYASRNHYSNWMVMAEITALGICASFARGRSKRSSFSEYQKIGVCVCIVLLGMGTSLKSGSRGGAAALMFGGFVFLFFLGRVIRARSVLAVIGATVLIFSVAILSSSVALDRMVGGDLGYKQRIWRDTARLILEFPLFGTGVGSFKVVSTIYKSFQGNQTFLHVENDYLEWVLEMGIPGLALLLLFWFRFTTKSAGLFSKNAAISVTALGVFAALAAFLFHSSFEFNFQIPANFFLFCALLGFHFSPRTATSAEPRKANCRFVQIWFNRAAAVLFLGLAAAFVSSSYFWRKGRNEPALSTAVHQLRLSNALWPYDSDHQMVLARACGLLETNLSPGVFPESEASVLRQIISRDAYNWEPRFDLLWLQLNLGLQTSSMVSNAWNVMKLNPLQTEIPMKFAESLAETDKEEAIRFIRAIPPAQNHALISTFSVGQKIDPSGSLLWSLAPNSDEGFTKLGDYAVNQNLKRLAAQAYLRVGPSMTPATKARKLLEISAAVEARQILAPLAPTPEIEALLAKSYYLTGNLPEAIARSRRSWKHLFEENGKPRALTLVEKIAIEISKQPPSQKQINDLRSLSSNNPSNLRIKWVLFECLHSQGFVAESAKAAMDLIARIYQI